MATITIVKHPKNHFLANIREGGFIVKQLYAETATAINAKAIAWCKHRGKTISCIVLR